MHGNNELNTLTAPKEGAIHAESLWCFLGTLKSRVTNKGEYDGEEPLPRVVEVSTLLCCSSMNKAQYYSQKREDSVEGGASWSVGKRPDLLGFVAKHFPRAGELKSI